MSLWAATKPASLVAENETGWLVVALLWNWEQQQRWCQCRQMPFISQMLMAKHTASLSPVVQEMVVPREASCQHMQKLPGFKSVRGAYFIKREGAATATSCSRLCSPLLFTTFANLESQNGWAVKGTMGFSPFSNTSAQLCRCDHTSAEDGMVAPF